MRSSRKYHRTSVLVRKSTVDSNPVHVLINTGFSNLLNDVIVFQTTPLADNVLPRNFEWLLLLCGCRCLNVKSKGFSVLTLNLQSLSG